jgi:2-polyprenyl-3-methyl-5-hydroxy-6-metoxy-1,4-benzoquinol methylase
MGVGVMRLIGESQDYIRGGTQKSEYAPEEVVEVACPLCGSEQRTRRYTEHGAIGVSQCIGCSLMYTSPRLRSPEQVYWGDAARYYEEARLIFEGKAGHHRDPNYRAEIETVERYKKAGRFLDVGWNMGMLLRLAMQRGWVCVGVEPSPSLAELAKKHGFPVWNHFLHEAPESENASFDVVALSDVFEHITEPLPFLRQAARLLKPDGILYVKVPNAKWNILKQRMLALLGRHPRQGLWDAYEHVVHYSDQTLRAMLTKGGFTVLKISTEPPVQTPNWHEYVGHYYQYPTPWFMDIGRKTGRTLFYTLSGIERLLRLGSLGYSAQNLVAVAKKR